MSSKSGAYGAAASRAGPRATNKFHEIRQREFRREQQYVKGEDPAKIPRAYFVPSLKEICAEVIANTFEQQPPADIEALQEKDRELYHLIVDQLRTDLKLEVSVPRVRVDEYWKACCEARWSLGQLAEFTKGYGQGLTPPEKGGWKRVYLERHLEETLMNMESSVMTEKEEESMVALCGLTGSEIYSLHLTRQRCHFDLFELFTKLPHLEEFLVTFGVLNANVTVTNEMLGMRQSDALHLQKVLRNARCLTRLSLPENKIDDDLCKAIVGGLVRNTTLLHLDLSHNRIADEGASALGLVLLQRDPALRLQTLDLSDNQIRRNGGAELGRGVAVTKSLTWLSLRLNRLDDEGGAAFLAAAANSSLTYLDLSNNELSSESARALVDLCGIRTSQLLTLNVSCNPFGADGGTELRQAATASPSLRSMDVRMCDMSADDEAAITAEMQRRVERKHLSSVADTESKMRHQIDELVARRIQKTHGK
jgi:hypothetical protein